MTVRFPRIRLLAWLIYQWRLILAGMLSFAAAAYMGTRPVPPLWTAPVSEQVSSYNVIGVTTDGRVVSIDTPPEEMAPARLRIRGGHTGVIIADHLIPDVQREDMVIPGRWFRNGVIAGDGEWVILASGGNGVTMVISLTTGELRYPALWGVYEVSCCSPDGKYAAFSSYNTAPDAEGNLQQIFDLEKGIALFSCIGDPAYFSPDSHRLICEQFDQGHRRVTVYSISDGAVLLSDVVPQIVDHRLGYLHHWSGSRAYFDYMIDEPGIKVPRNICWSYDTTGDHLDHGRFEPLIHGHLVTSSEYTTVVFRGRYLGEVHFRVPPDEETVLGGIVDYLDDIGISLWDSRTQYYWQPLSLEDGSPCGLSIPGLSHHFKLSPDGNWLAEDQDELRVWRLPATRSVGHWFTTLLAGLLPWGIIATRKRRVVDRPTVNLELGSGSLL